jgi:hypothetical protein
VGTIVPLPAELGRPHSPVLVIAISAKCNACREAAPFLRRLVSACDSERDIKVIVAVASLHVVEEDLAMAGRLVSGGIDVVAWPITESPLRVVPSVLVLDESGRIEFVYEGLPDPAGEGDVMAGVLRALRVSIARHTDDGV